MKEPTITAPVAVKPAAPVAVTRLPVEVWAQKKGHGTVEKIIPARGPRSKPVTIVRGAPDRWRFDAAKNLAGWIHGQEITEAEYDAAVERGASGKVA